MNSEDIVKKIKDTGSKVTKARRLIIEILLNSSSPISVLDILAAFDSLKIPVNKTTVYREVSFLKAQQIVTEIDLGEGKKRYELNTDTHHHHIVCINCEKIEDIPFEKDIHLQEEKIEKNINFKILNHNLEFFGLCQSCQ